MTTILSFLAALAILVVVHELGHYLAARWVGVKVLRFSVGFGQPLLIKRWGVDATEWSIAAIPLGGYVKMLDEREAPVAEHELARAFNRQTVWARMLIVVAGPVANLLLAILLYWGVYLHGVPALKPILAEPSAQTAAAMAGLHNGDEITAIDNQTIRSWADVNWALLRDMTNKSQVSIKLDGGGTRVMDITAANLGEGKVEVASQLGLRLFEPAIPAVIAQVLDGGAAQRAGLRVGDKIVQVNQQSVAQWADFVHWVRGHAGQVLSVAVLRGHQPVSLSLTPDRTTEAGVTVGKIGAGPEVDASVFQSMMTTVNYSVGGALLEGVTKTWQMSVFSLQMMGRMLTGEVSWHNLSGPLTIADYAGQSARHGWLSFVGFLALVSISLGVLNLLPIPLLDGGHLMYYIAEAVKGSPVSDRIMDLGQRFGMAALLTMMVFAFYNDISRLLGTQ
ncbi:MAG: RIP metalloprotease RseP [Sulfuriferula sp.]|nr:RIP metalloprotease RseP [Sulfuriferula sp.]